jgi:ABC-type sugar transport system substrate-binding protein
MPKRGAKYGTPTRREVKEDHLQLVKRVGQATVAVIGLGSAVSSFTAFGVSWTTIAFAVIIIALLVSVLANVLFFVNAHLNAEQPKRIAFLAPSSGGQPFYTAMLIGLVQSASLALGQNYLILPSMPTQSFESMSIWALFAGLEDRQVDIDGIIFIPDDPDRHFDEIVGFHEERGDIPLVLVDVFFDLATCDVHTQARLPSFVGGDEIAGGRIAADIIIDALGAPPTAPVVLLINGGSAPWEQQRAHAFRERVRQKWPAAQFIESPPFNYSRPAAFAHTVELFKAMASTGHEVELHAIFACNDDMAIGARTAVVRVLSEGFTFVQPPQIVGYDGISEIREYINAEDIYIAGTVDVRVEEQARAAMLLMHKLLRSRERRSDIELIAPQAVQRAGI